MNDAPKHDSHPAPSAPAPSATRIARRRILKFGALAAAAFILPDAYLNSNWAQDLSTYTLGAGDKVKLTVYGEPDLSGEFQIDGTGKAALPLIGNVQLGGLSLRDAEARVTSALKPNYLKDPKVNIEVLNYRPFYILGEVKNPGSFPYVDGMTVLNAVALAGGFTYRARESSMTITRATDPTHQEQEANPDTPIMPGDIVRVPERFF